MPRDDCLSARCVPEEGRVARWHALRFAPIQPIAHQPVATKRSACQHALKNLARTSGRQNIGNDHFSCSSLPMSITAHYSSFHAASGAAGGFLKLAYPYLHVSTLPASAANPSRRASVRLRRTVRQVAGPFADHHRCWTGRVRVPVLILASVFWRLPLRPRSWSSLSPISPSAPSSPSHGRPSTSRAGIQRGCRPDHVLDLSRVRRLLEPLFSKERLRTNRHRPRPDRPGRYRHLVPAFDIDGPHHTRRLLGRGLRVDLRRAVAAQSSIRSASFQHHRRALPGRFAAVVLLPFAAAHWPVFTLHDVLLLLVLGVLCTAIAHSLFIDGLKGINTRTASMIACLEPVYGPILPSFSWMSGRPFALSSGERSSSASLFTPPHSDRRGKHGAVNLAARSRIRQNSGT